MKKQIHSALFRYILLLTMVLGVSGRSFAQVVIPDSNFRECLKVYYPFIMDASGKLIPNEAAKLRRLICTTMGIESVEGIQHFGSLVDLDLRGNKLSQLPSLANLDSLRSLNLYSNQLTSLPNLDDQSKLMHLDIVDNRLAQLPSLNKLVNLTSLLARGNELTSLPAMDSLKGLQALDLSYNKLSRFPVLPENNTIRTLNLNNNQYSVLPDSFIFPNLEKMFLYDNNLTFTELSKIRKRVGYENLFVIRPQNTFSVGRTIEVKEKESLIVATGIDASLAGVQYEWSKNGSFHKIIRSDELMISSAEFSDSGKYTCKITWPSFPMLSLHTDTFFVNVIPCLDPSVISMASTSINCRKNGTLSLYNKNNESFTYFLKSPVSGTVMTSQSGFFSGLTEPDYTLSIQNVNKCEKAFPYPIKIIKEECKQTLITPNGDGESESYFFAHTGQVTIYDKRGAIVKTLSIPNEWDGTAKSGRVSPGYYIADINNGEELVNISVVY